MTLKLNAPGGGSVTIDVPTTASNFTLTAPASTGNVVVSPQPVTVPNTTGTVMVSGNMPAFSGYRNTNQTISASTWTKVQINTKEFDTANAFDATTNYRFQPTVAGYYQVNGELDMYAGGSNITNSLLSIWKNGVDFKRGSGVSAGSTEIYTTVSALVYLNGSTDYIELYNNTSTSGTPVIQSSSGFTTYFQAALVRAA